MSGIRGRRDLDKIHLNPKAPYCIIIRNMARQIALVGKPLEDVNECCQNNLASSYGILIRSYLWIRTPQWEFEGLEWGSVLPS